MLPQLSRRIKCKESVKIQLSEETTNWCNKIVMGLTEDDPALVVQITDFEAVHDALGVNAVPAGLRQGVTPEASFVNFCNWLIERTHDEDVGVGPRHQAGGVMSTCWHHLSDEQATQITNRQWHFMRWCVAIEDARSAIRGPLCLVLKMTGTGRGRAHMFEVPQIFG